MTFRVDASNRICCRWPVFTTCGIYALRFGVLLHLILQVFSSTNSTAASEPASEHITQPDGAGSKGFRIRVPISYIKDPLDRNIQDFIKVCTQVGN